MGMKSAFNYATQVRIIRRSAAIAMVVGPILIMINQGDRIIGGGGIDLLKAALTFVVPFCVATYGAVVNRVASQEPCRPDLGAQSHRLARSR